ncbi:MAG TPA: hypothetical protein VKU02_04940 [Gemmataceae bacterium]|nr:hypothetical protein [Gemmataceae bacterium]
MSLTPPTYGTHPGVVAFQDCNSSTRKDMPGNGNLKITGTIFTPAAPLSVQANNSDKTDSGISKDKIGSQIVVNNLSVSGNGGFSVSGRGGTPVRVIQLIE